MDLTELISESGIRFGALTLTAAIKAAVTLLVGIVLIRVFLSLFDRAMDRSEKLSPLRRHLRPIHPRTTDSTFSVTLHDVR